MRTKVTLILIFLNVALFFFIFYVRPQWATMDQLKEARKRVLPATAVDIQTLEIASETQVTRLEKHGDQWVLAKPIEWPANIHAVTRILSELQLLEHKTSFDVGSLAQNKLSLADYGLEKPALTVTLVPGVGKAGGNGAPAPDPIVLRIGNPTNVGNRLYILSPDGQRVHVVDRSLADSLTLPLDQLRSDKLFTIPEFEVRSLNIQIAPSTRVYVLRDGNRWALETPVRARADSAAVKQTITSLSTLAVGNFVQQAPAPELNPSITPTFRITLGGNNRSETLLIGGPVAQGGDGAPGVLYYAQIDKKNSVFTLPVPTGLLEVLRSAQDKLRETKLLDIDMRSVSSIILRSPNQPPLTLQRLESAGADSAASWQMVRRIGNAAPSVQAADTGAVQHLLDNLGRLSALQFLTDAPTAADEESWGFNSPEREIVIQYSEQPENGARQATPVAGVPKTQTLQIGVGAERGPRAYARLDAARYVYAVDADVLRKTPVDAKQWRDRHLRELPAGAKITSVRLTDLSNQKVLLEGKLPADASSPDALVPASATPEQKAAWLALLEQLRSLKAKSFAADRYQDSVMAGGEERRWRYQLDVDISLSGGAGAQAVAQTLVFTDRIGGGQQFAGSKDLDSVFEIEQPLLDALWTFTYPAQPGAIPETTAGTKP